MVPLPDPAALDVQGAGQEKDWLPDYCVYRDNWNLRKWQKDGAKSRGKRDERWEQKKPAFSCSPYYSLHDFSPSVTESLQRSLCLNDSWIKIQLLLIPAAHGCSDWHQHVLERYRTCYCPPEWSKQEKASLWPETLSWNPRTVFLGSVEGGLSLRGVGMQKSNLAHVLLFAMLCL